MSKNGSEKDLYIDGQVFQTDAWNRGMGKYSLSLLNSISKQIVKDYKTVTILINQNLKFEDSVKEEILVACPGVQIASLPLITPSPRRSVKEIQPLNKRTLNEFLANHRKTNSQSDFLLLCLFLDEACAVFPDSSRKLLLFYDLIPFLYQERYQNRINYQDYLQHFKTIYEADKIFTISQTVADDMEVYLGIKKDKLKNIDGASIDRSGLTSKKPKIPLKEKFILMPSGDELRKNNVRAVRGFEQFNSTKNNEYQLIITSRFSDGSIAEISNYSNSVIFTGNIPGSELQWLYENSEFVLFASEYEGLGLPILEAMSVNKKIACSNIPVFREISEDALFFFDCQDTSSIAETLDSVLLSAEWQNKSRLYKDILKKYSWVKTAEKFKDGLSTLPDIDSKNPISKKRIAMLMPHPAGFSAIGKVVSESHAAFSELFEVDYYFDHGVFHRPVRPDFLSSIANCYEAIEFNATKYAEYDEVIYHIGNSDYHLESIKNALYLPGVVILHDTYLDGAFQGLVSTEYISEQRNDLEKTLTDLLSTDRSSFLCSIVNGQKAVITHSKYAANSVKELLLSNVLVSPSNLPVSVPELTKPRRKRFTIGLAGIIADVKGLQIIEDIASSDLFSDCEIKIFGHNFAKPEVAEQFKKWTNVKVQTNPSDFDFQTSMASLDVLVNYRLEYRGETSLTVLEAMRYGTAVIVRDIGWYSELPDSSVIKVNSPDEVVESLAKLQEDPDYLAQMQLHAKELVSKNFSHTAYTASIAKIIEKTKDESLVSNKISDLLKSRASKQEISKYLDPK